MKYYDARYERTLSNELHKRTGLVVESYVEVVPTHLPQGSSQEIYRSSYHWSTPSWKSYPVIRLIDADKVDDRIIQLKNKMEEFKDSDLSKEDILNFVSVVQTFCDGGDL